MFVPLWKTVEPLPVEATWVTTTEPAPSSFFSEARTTRTRSASDQPSSLWVRHDVFVFFFLHHICLLDSLALTNWILSHCHLSPLHFHQLPALTPPLILTDPDMNNAAAHNAKKNTSARDAEFATANALAFFSVVGFTQFTTLTTGVITFMGEVPTCVFFDPVPDTFDIYNLILQS
ncbi:hypothetical protein B0H11DRAFT_2278785 [Mycena galericulata]|nr:hypothetical protein B0H11DRAFT_2278785 [Mycena galericulata]